MNEDTLSVQHTLYIYIHIIELCATILSATECRYKSHRRCAYSVAQGCKWTTRESIARDGYAILENVSGCGLQVGVAYRWVGFTSGCGLQMDVVCKWVWVTSGYDLQMGAAYKLVWLTGGCGLQVGVVTSGCGLQVGVVYKWAWLTRYTWVWFTGGCASCVGLSSSIYIVV